MPLELITCPHCRKSITLTAAISRQIQEKLNEDYKLKNLEQDKLIRELRKQIDNLKHKAETGSQELQGEVLELDLEERLRANFYSDKLKPVPKGVSGADILQEVYDHRDRYCGAIIWETKRWKKWRDVWIEKLKHDQRTANADVAVLLTKTLPPNCERFRQVNDVWVTNYACAIDLAIVLRNSLVEMATAKRATAGKHSKMADLHDYLISANFRSRVEAIVETFVSMKDDLDQEKRAYEKIWKKRERQIAKIISNISCIAGDLEGVADSSMLQIKSLELPTLTDGNED